MGLKNAVTTLRRKAVLTLVKPKLYIIPINMLSELPDCLLKLSKYGV